MDFDGLFLQVETMHDFEAANSDELELKRGDVVLVVPTTSAEDQVRTHAWGKNHHVMCIRTTKLHQKHDIGSAQTEQ